MQAYEIPRVNLLELKLPRSLSLQLYLYLSDAQKPVHKSESVGPRPTRSRPPLCAQALSLQGNSRIRNSQRARPRKSKSLIDFSAENHLQ